MPRTDRAVLTTGANSGLGLAAVLEVARRGYRSVGSVRSEAKARMVEDAARAAGVAVETVLLDVTDADACAEVVGRLEPLWGLVNNAGYGGVGAVEGVPDDEVRARLETMVIAPVRLARLALPGMRARGGGRIVKRLIDLRPHDHAPVGLVPGSQACAPGRVGCAPRGGGPRRDRRRPHRARWLRHGHLRR